MKSSLKRRTYGTDYTPSPSSPMSEKDSNISISPSDTESEIEDSKDKKIKSDIFAPRDFKFEKKKQDEISRNDLYVLIGLTILSMVTRWYKIGWGNRAIWDEAHFGKFGSFYLQHYHHHDVHPPLAKLLIALAGKIAGYDGSHDFTSGEKFPPSMNHSLMRGLVALFGIVIVPVSFLTTKAFGLSKRCQYLTAFLVLFDNGFIVISKFILLDPFLLCFTSLTLLFWAHFYNNRNRPFTKPWYWSLLLLGACMGLNCSVKWGVPLFLLSLVGLYTLRDLRIFWYQKGLDKRIQAFHWLARILCLIIVPVSIYLISFDVHFRILNSTGKDDYSMDSVFLARLNGTGLDENRIDVAFGANITLRATILNGGLLHSHDFKYPEGSREQQVTSFRDRDYNDFWTVKDPFENNQNDEPVLVKDGSIIQFLHQTTGKYLTTQPEYDSPKSGSRAYEVSASNLENNKRSHWKVIVYDDRQYYSPIDSIKTVTTRLKLLNVEGNCLLGSADRHLPHSWGFFHLEVNCVKNTASKADEVLWNFEFNQHPKLPIAPKGHIKRRFLWDLARVHHAMWSTNVGLIPDPDKFDHLASVALDWPLLRRGIAMCSWHDKDIKFFMFGNPAVWWLTSLAMVIYPMLYLIYVTRNRRLFREWTQSAWERFNFIGYLTYGCWAIHFLPFMIMSRVLYLHHYFPSLYFACLATPYVLELSLNRLSSNLVDKLFIIIAITVFTGFIYFSPLTYGFDYPGTDIKYLQWMESWDFIRQKP